MGSCRFRRLSFIAVGAICAASVVDAGCSEDQVTLRGPFGEAQFSVDLADSDEERSRGLMFVEQMATMQGMLFAYDSPRAVSFWMRNTLIPLDMIFVDETGVVRNIHRDAQPLDETTIFGGGDIQYVLEVNGGLAARLGLDVGDEMQHPSFGEDSVWPCVTN